MLTACINFIQPLFSLPLYYVFVVIRRVYLGCRLMPLTGTLSSASQIIEAFNALRRLRAGRLYPKVLSTHGIGIRTFVMAVFATPSSVSRVVPDALVVA